jgi:hypothetical protein
MFFVSLNTVKLKLKNRGVLLRGAYGAYWAR